MKPKVVPYHQIEERSTTEQLLEILEVATKVSMTQRGALSFFFPENQAFILRHKFTPDSFYFEQTLCEYVAQRQSLLEVKDSIEEYSMKSRYFLGLNMPSTVRCGFTGSLCLFDPFPRILTPEVKEVLKLITKVSSLIIEAQTLKQVAIEKRLNFGFQETDHFIHETNNALNLSSCLISSIHKKINESQVEIGHIFKRMHSAHYALQNIFEGDEKVECATSQAEKILMTFQQTYANNITKISMTLLLEHGIALNISCKEMYQIVSNLILNALEATRGREFRDIKILLTRCKKNIYISVKDNGVGIKASDQQKLFNTIFTTKEAKDFSGRGLKMIYDKACRAGGKMSFKSIQNKGTQFIVELPIGHQR